VHDPPNLQPQPDTICEWLKNLRTPKDYHVILAHTVGKPVAQSGLSEIIKFALNPGKKRGKNDKKTQKMSHFLNKKQKN